jgi:hypothetical protein
MELYLGSTAGDLESMSHLYAKIKDGSTLEQPLVYTGEKIVAITRGGALLAAR